MKGDIEKGEKENRGKGGVDDNVGVGGEKRGRKEIEGEEGDQEPRNPLKIAINVCGSFYCRVHMITEPRKSNLNERVCQGNYTAFGLLIAAAHPSWRGDTAEGRSG
ncbi:hypothetical protein E2C01_077878 [Portunus trituberculatus]|uniref:Uncharacterized protein n=1 Tax=Portunus trituberculatus TaxID=210409 RepID=A0A5B7IMH1_PORTR|nr:hypothetical protein [Portunus trituberculatus]